MKKEAGGDGVGRKVASGEASGQREKIATVQIPTALSVSATPVVPTAADTQILQAPETQQTQKAPDAPKAPKTPEVQQAPQIPPAPPAPPALQGVSTA